MRNYIILGVVCVAMLGVLYYLYKNWLNKEKSKEKYAFRCCFL